MRGCFGRVLALGALALLLLAAWRWGPDLWDRVRGELSDPGTEVASPELARAAWERYQGLVERGEGEIRLSGVELESILRFQLADRFPAGVSDPSIRIRDGEVALGLRVAAERIPAIPELESVRGILPDTVPVQLRGRLLTLAGGEAVLLVHRIDASAVPIPRRFFPRILEGLVREERTSLPPEALPIPLPDEVGRVRVEGDFLFLRPPS